MVLFFKRQLYTIYLFIIFIPLFFSISLSSRSHSHQPVVVHHQEPLLPISAKIEKRICSGVHTPLPKESTKSTMKLTYHKYCWCKHNNNGNNTKKKKNNTSEYY